MDKIVQVTFVLPKIPVEDFTDFVKTISPEIEKDISEYLYLIMPAMQNNPRQLKRFLNNLSLQTGIIQNKDLARAQGD